MASWKAGDSGPERSAPVIATPPAGDNRGPIDGAPKPALADTVSVIRVSSELRVRTKMNPSSARGKQRVRGLDSWRETFLSGSILTATQVVVIGSKMANGSLQTHITTRGSSLPRSP